MKDTKQNPGKGQPEQPSRVTENSRDKAKKRDDEREPYQEETGEQGKGLKTSDLPDATNESMGAMGSGQRQDSN
jgi:hypothetical protein